jgi:hypothetical protein
MIKNPNSHIIIRTSLLLDLILLCMQFKGGKFGINDILDASICNTYEVKFFLALLFIILGHLT